MSLLFAIESDVPARFAVGGGNVLLLRGWALRPDGVRVTELQGRLGDTSWVWPFRGEVRVDLARDESVPARAQDKAVAGFYVPFEVPAQLAGATRRLELVARTVDGKERALIDQAIELVPRAPAGEPAGRRVAVALATYRPDLALLERQLASLCGQSLRDWTAVVRDDGSPPELQREIAKLCARDPRLRFVAGTHNLGFYKNFEAALAALPVDAELIALCDQDDRWYEDKLATLVAEIDGSGAQLVYSDMRLVDPSGRVLAGSYWERRRNNFQDFDALLLANTVTGAASLFRREVLERALPFPEPIGSAFHDHWLACVALAMGRIDYVDRPLYDYTQHGRNVIGFAGFSSVPEHLRAVLRRLREGALDPLSVPERWAAEISTYQLEYRRLQLYRMVLSLRLGALDPARTRALDLFADRLRDGVNLLVPGALKNLWRGNTTDFAEVRLGRALLLERGFRRLFPAALVSFNGAMSLRRGRPGAAPPTLESRVQSYRDKVAPLALTVERQAPRRVNLLLPELDVRHLFGGYLGKLHLALALARRGHRVRLLLVDHCPIDRARWRRELLGYPGLEELLEHVEVESGQPRSRAITVSPDDALIATTFWTAHVAHAAARTLGRARFVYLIQEYEPFTHPMGAWSALAEQSYALPHHALFSTALLERLFRRQGTGVFSTVGGEHQSFENAIARRPPDWAEVAARRTRKLLFYCRPEEHAARNLFELGAAALERAIEAGTFEGWELRGIGASRAGELRLGGRVVQLLPRASLADYERELPRNDVGLSLMYTPHPSLVPIEMAAAGMRVVTNTCLDKDQTALAAISSNFVSCEATVDDVARALGEAAASASDVAARRAGADVRWATSWAEAFSPSLLDRLEGWLAP